jgi:predicted DNA-binding transcriptional regulator AlpA
MLQNPSSNASPKTDAPLLINAQEFATMLGVSQRTLWRMLSAQQVIKPLRFGGNTRWRLDDVRDWIDSGCQPPTSSTSSQS